MALSSAGQIKKQIEKLRKDLNAAVGRAEKQRKLAQNSLGSLLSRARSTLSSLGSSRIAKLLGGARKKSAPAKRAAKKAVSRAKKAAKSAQRSVNKAARSATRTAKKVRSQAKKVQTQAKRRVKSAQKAVKKVQKRVQASLPQLPLSGGSMSRAAMATSKGRATAPTPPPSPPAMEAPAAQNSLPL